MTDVLRRSGNLDGDLQREDSHVNVKAEIGVMQLQCQGLPGTLRSWRSKERSPLTASGGGAFLSAP